MSILKRLSPSQKIWLALGLGAILLRILFGFSATLCENLYSRGFFLGLRFLMDHSWTLLPFAAVYILFGILIFWIVFSIVRLKKNPTRSWKEWCIQRSLAFISFCSAIVFLFLTMWGFNYARIPIETQIKIDPKPLNYEELLAETAYIQSQCSLSRLAIQPLVDTFALTENLFPDELEKEMHLSLVKVLKRFGYPTMGWVRGRQLYPKGLLYGFSSSGVYIPFTGEGHIEAGLHILQKPFTLAHEMSHGYGFGDEATCNFLGYLACLESEHPIIQYSGYLMYWRYVLSELREIDHETYKLERNRINRGMSNDLEAIYTEMDKYAEWMPQFQRVAYDAFLKTQGVKEGVKSYDRMVVMVAAWRKASNK